MKKDDYNNLKTFKSINEIKKPLLQRKGFKKAIYSGIAFLVAAACFGPYVYNHVESESTINKYTPDTVNVFVETSDTSNLPDEVVYGSIPEGFSFDNNIVAYMSSSGDILDKVYPITQSSLEDPNYYLYNNIDGINDGIGNIYKDSRNHEGLRDDVTIIYGHNLIDDKMFGKITEYADKDTFLGSREGQDLYDQEKEKFGEEGNSFTYIDEYGQYQLDVCAAGVYNGMDIINNIGNFSNLDEKKKFIDYINANSDIDSLVNLDANSKIVILQTCEDGDSNTYTDKEKRVYVICKAKELVRYNDFPSKVI